MRKILPLFSCLILFDLQGQSHADSLEIIWQTFFIEEINRDLFKNVNHPDSSIYIIYNKVSPDSVYNPIMYKHEDLHIFFYPRSYIMGHDINYWMIIDSLNIEKESSAVIFFTIMYSEDNWIEGNDKPVCRGQVYFERFYDKTWRVKKKRVQETKKYK